MAKKCSKRQSYVKSYRRSNGKRVKSHCKKARKSQRRSRKLKCSPPKSKLVKSYKRKSGKRVKSHCKSPSQYLERRFANLQSIRDMQPVIRRVDEFIAPVQDLKPSVQPQVMPVVKNEVKPCRDMEQTECKEALDENNLRRCRVNISSKLCEDLPIQFRQRATLQVGGSAEYRPYVAGERMRLTEERLRPYQVDEEGRRFRSVMDESERLIAEGRRRRQ